MSRHIDFIEKALASHTHTSGGYLNPKTRNPEEKSQPFLLPEPENSYPNKTQNPIFKPELSSTSSNQRPLLILIRSPISPRLFERVFAFAKKNVAPKARSIVLARVAIHTIKFEISP